MKLIIGLGNSRRKYENTRHNIGFWLIDQLKNFQFSPRLRSGQAIFNFQLTKSTVLMNESGRFVKKLVDRYKLPLDELLIIHDDLDVSLGDFRLQKGRGAAGHKGVESVISALGSCDFWRLRIGIGRPRVGVNPEEYVLTEFTMGEKEQLHGLADSITKKVESWTKT